MKGKSVKNLALRLATGLLTLLIGILASTQLPQLLVVRRVAHEATDSEVWPAEAPVDFAEYRVDLLDLLQNGNRYDGKVIRVKGNFTMLENSSVGNLEAGLAWLRAICVADQTTCSELFTQPDFGNPTLNSVAVEVVGRFTLSAHDPHPLQRGDKVRLLEISKVISATPYNEGMGSSNGDDSGCGRNDAKTRSPGCGSGSGSGRGNASWSRGPGGVREGL